MAKLIALPIGLIVGVVFASAAPLPVVAVTFAAVVVVWAFAKGLKQ